MTVMQRESLRRRLDHAAGFRVIGTPRPVRNERPTEHAVGDDQMVRLDVLAGVQVHIPAGSVDGADSAGGAANRVGIGSAANRASIDSAASRAGTVGAASRVGAADRGCIANRVSVSAGDRLGRDDAGPQPQASAELEALHIAAQISVPLLGAGVVGPVVRCGVVRILIRHPRVLRGQARVVARGASYATDFRLGAERRDVVTS